MKNDIQEDSGYPILLKEGVYTAQCIDVSVVLIKKYNRRAIFLKWEILVNGIDRTGQFIFEQINYPEKRDWNRAWNSKFVQESIKVSRKRPTYLNTLSPDVFKNRICEVYVTTVKTDDRGDKRIEESQYSIVDRIKQLIA